MVLIDVVNLNADASCLSSGKWLQCLTGGRNSTFFRMLENYVRHRRKVNLGLTGSTLQDLQTFLPESIAYINDHSETFELVLRPFAHDNPLLRLPEGFRYNLTLGMECLRKAFKNVNRYYLAPEVLITGEQIHICDELGVQGIFLHKGRYEEGIRAQLPDVPYLVRGVLNSYMTCIPFISESLERLYLDALHAVVEPLRWASALKKSATDTVYLWRDGESSLLLPGGVQREAELFRAEQKSRISRAFLSETHSILPKAFPRGTRNYFPASSLTPWLRQMKMHWYVLRVRDIEREFASLSPFERRLWLLLIGSDILSSAEKESPKIRVGRECFRVDPADPGWQGVVPRPRTREVVLTRSERAAEGEDYLAHFEAIQNKTLSREALLQMWSTSGEPHLQKALARVVSKEETEATIREALA